MGAGGARSPGDYYDATVPLFGEETTAVKTFDVAFGVVTVVFVIVTLALLFSRSGTSNVDVFFGVVLILVTIPQVILVLWFRRGDLHPKFRWLIAYMMVTVILLCMCGIGYVRWHNGLCN
eukprot:m.446021 g.446021  ORF g.446021 m.446021 type:complete len:120 (+) comp19301_c0_seq1:193-552(+)